jgi:hypothetical protein
MLESVAIEMLHIHNGDSTAGTARKTDLPGEHLAWREALVCGPTPSGVSDDDFRQLRARHLSDAYGLRVEDSAKDLREQHEALAQFVDHEEIVLWFEHDLFCQVHLIYLLNWFSQSELGKTTLSLICIDSFPGIDDFRGLGQLNEDQLASLFPQRRAISSAQLNLGSKAWQAYSSSDPSHIESLLAEDTTALPFLKSALFKHLERFPSLRNGLGHEARLCLELVADGHSEFKALFPEFGKREPLYGFGDAQVLLELKRLTKGLHPLLTMNNDGNANSMDSVQFLSTLFRITDRGQAVLNGDEDFVKLNGIDLWLGGVHLQGNEAAWRWDEDHQRLDRNANC